MNATAKALGVVSLLPLLKDDPQPGCLIESESHANILLTQCRRYYQEGKFTDVSIHCQVRTLLTTNSALFPVKRH